MCCKKAALRLDLAILLDASIFCERTYRLEEDRLEMFCLGEDIEAIREKGKIIGDTMRALPNVAAILREDTKIAVWGHEYMTGLVHPIVNITQGKCLSCHRVLNRNMYEVTFSDGATIPLTMLKRRATPLTFEARQGGNMLRAHSNPLL